MNARHDAAVPNTESMDSHRMWKGAFVQHSSSMRLPVQGKTAWRFVQPVQGEGGTLPGQQQVSAGSAGPLRQGRTALRFDKVQVGLGWICKLSTRLAPDTL